jgi:hypothetical protein
MKAVMRGNITELRTYFDAEESIQGFVVLVEPSPYMNDNVELMNYWKNNYISVNIILEAGLIVHKGQDDATTTSDP